MRLLACFMVLMAASTSVAQSRSYEAMAPFWREVREPGYARARTLVRHGVEFLIKAEEEHSDFRRAALLESAIIRFERAHDVAPRDPEALFYLARALHWYEQPSLDGGPPERRVEEAIAAFEALRELDAEFEAQRVGFELGNLYSRKQMNAEAIAEYLMSLEHSFGSRLASVTHSNLAEVYMLDGQLVEAISHYEEAIRIAQGQPDQALSLMLALWGSAVAHDRLGEHRRALERAREALSAGGGGMEVLTSDGVYFEPAAEIHFYQGLGHMAAAQDEAEARAKRQSLRQARQSWRSYLRLSLPEDPWRSLAERHLGEVEADLESTQAPRQSASR